MEETNYTVLYKIANFFPDETENAIINFAKMWVTKNMN
jgi:hypothetical protein